MKFLDIRLTKADPGYSEFSAELDSNSVTFNWQFFDPNAFFEVLILVWSETESPSLPPSVEIANLGQLYDYCNPSFMLAVFNIGLFLFAFGSVIFPSFIFMDKMSDSRIRLISFLGNYMFPLVLLFILVSAIVIGAIIVGTVNVIFFSRHIGEVYSILGWIDPPNFAENISCADNG